MSGMSVETDHALTMLNPSTMVLTNNEDGRVLATARLENGSWTVSHTDAEDDETSRHPSKTHAHKHMIESHVAIHGGGYSTWVAHDAYESMAEALAGM